MAGECGVCKLKTSRNAVVCNDCGQSSHLRCVNMTKEELDYLTTGKQIWRCKPCTSVRRQSMQAVTDAEEGKASLSQVIFMLEEAREDRKRMEKEMNTSFEFLHNIVKDNKTILDEQSVKINNFITDIENLQSENAALRKQIKELEMKIDECEQYSRSNTIEIHGIPENRAEDTYELVKNVACALGVMVTRESIDICHRLGKRPDFNGPAAIIARFVRREDKNKIVEKRRVKRNFNTSDLGLEMPASPIYVNESLSPSRRKLLAAAREAKRDKNYTYLWVRHGNIRMRKDPGTPVKYITTRDDIANL